jgi:hypothetical protein
MTSFGVQLSLELANAFPIREVVGGATRSAISFARKLKATGSDLIVEQDLADIFGRGRIEGELQKVFKKLVSVMPSKTMPIYKNSQMYLDAGPGETVLRAVTSTEGYLATVIQLSLLGWVHERGYLASALEKAIRIRFQSNIRDANPAPGFDELVGTLEACSSQTSAFHWDTYVTEVELKIRKTFPGYQYDPQFICLTRNALSAAMDCLYIVQSLPDDRKIMFSSNRGSITIIIWAYYLLELTIVLKGVPGGDIRFGSQETEHIIICWVYEEDGPEVSLFNAEMEIILKATPDEDTGSTALLSAASERIPLCRYGIAYVRRYFYTSYIVDNLEVLFPDTIHLAIALARRASRRVRRVQGDLSNTRRKQQVTYIPVVELERWRILDAATQLFGSQMEINESLVESFVDSIADNPIHDIHIPSSLKQFLEKTGQVKDKRSFHDFMEAVVQLIFLISHIIEISSDEIRDVPLVYHRGKCLPSVINLSSPKEHVELDPTTLYYGLGNLLVGGGFGAEERKSGEYSFLASEFGWSVFLSTVGTNDPSTIRPELLHLQKGVLTNNETEYRGNRLRDASFTWHWDPSSASQMLVIDRGSKYIPRCLTQVKQRKEFYESRSKIFLLSISFLVDRSRIPQSESSEWMAKKFEMHSSFRYMHNELWSGVLSTLPCTHSETDSGGDKEEERALGLGAVTIAGLGDLGKEFQRQVPERVCIALTRGDRDMRWLTLLAVRCEREWNALLRGEGCCEDCAFDEASRKSGRWIVIL